MGFMQRSVSKLLTAIYVCMNIRLCCTETVWPALIIWYQINVSLTLVHGPQESEYQDSISRTNCGTCIGFLPNSFFHFSLASIRTKMGALRTKRIPRTRQSTFLSQRLFGHYYSALPYSTTIQYCKGKTCQ